MNQAMAEAGQLEEERRTAFQERQRHTCQTKVAYIMSRFPKLTETFILYEMLAVEKAGVQVEVYPLLRARNTTIHPEGAPLWRKLLERLSSPQVNTVMHPEAASLVNRAHFQPFFSRRILRAQMYFLRRKPGAYLGALWAVLRGTWGSPKFLGGALDIFPRTVYFAYQMAADGVTHVHAHFANHPAAAAFIIHRLSGIPYSFTAHGSDLHVDRHMLREKVAEAAFVVAISNYNKQLIIEEGGEQFRDKILVIHCGVDTQAFHPPHDVRQYKRNGSDKTPLPLSLSRPANPFTIICIGLLQEVKGQTYLVEACRLLRERGIDFICNFVGDGPDRAVLSRQAVTAGLADRVHFLGWRTREQTIKLLQGAHVLALPSVPTRSGKREGIPVVLMEAMASGVPVVASGISGIPELVGHQRSGLLVPPRDAPAMASALERLQGDPVLRQHLAKAGREKVVREFDLYTNAAILAQRFVMQG